MIEHLNSGECFNKQDQMKAPAFCTFDIRLSRQKNGVNIIIMKRFTSTKFSACKVRCNKKELMAQLFSELMSSEYLSKNYLSELFLSTTFIFPSVDLEGKVEWLANFERMRELQQMISWPPIEELDSKLSGLVPEVRKLFAVFVVVAA